ncbi:hypothetical protein PQX77_007945 [Marasmius sp. AFHP31]|nr:hypothetical protein PQX77_007945 [Marasmius sp. AFHP31]
MLTTISSPHFCTVVFHLMGSTPRWSPTEWNEVLPMLNLCDKWNRIDDLLFMEKFAMCAIELIVPSLTNKDDLVTSARNTFPKADRTGRFSVTRAPFKSMNAPGGKRYQSHVEEEMEWVCNRQY